MSVIELVNGPLDGEQIRIDLTPVLNAVAEKKCLNPYGKLYLRVQDPDDPAKRLEYMTRQTGPAVEDVEPKAYFVPSPG